MTLSPALPAPAVPERAAGQAPGGAPVTGQPAPAHEPWGIVHARAAVAAAAPVLALDPAALEEVRALSTVVLRHGARAVKVYPPTVDVDRLRRVVAAVPADTGDLVLPELGRPPLVVTPAGTVSTYRWLEPSGPATWAEIGRLLAALHATAGVDVATLPRWTPLSRVPAQLAAYAASPGHDPDVVAVLSAARERVLGQLGAMTSDLGWGLIHGDVSVENVLRDRGRPVFVDLDWVACGPREYDLVPAALRRERGEIDEETYLGFCAAYGHDVRRWGGLGLVEDVCELGALTFSLWASAAEGRDLSWAPQAARRWA